MVLRRPRTSTTCEVHERRRVLVHFYRSNQPWRKGAGASLTYRKHVSSRSPNIKLIVRPFSIPYLFKTHRYRIFFLFGVTWKQTFFLLPSHNTNGGVGFLYCLSSFFRSYCKPVCVVRTRWVGSYKYRSKMQAIIMFRIRATQQGSNTW
jgi:hypothetical protein